MQTLDVQAQNPARQLPHAGVEGVKAGPKAAVNGKTGAETARNGSSFLAMIEKMIAGTMEGKADALKASSLKTTERGAGDGTGVPGDGNTLNKQVSGKSAKASGKTKMPAETLAAANGKAPGAAKEQGESDKPHAAGKSGLKFLPAAGVEAAAAGSSGDPDLDKGLDGKNAPDAPESSGKAGTNGDAAALVLAKTAAANRPPAPAQAGSAENGTGAGEPEKIGKTERKERKTLISVRDERQQAETTAMAAKGGLEKTVRFNTDGTADMTIGFGAANAGSSSRADTESRFMEKGDGKQGQSFASMLSSELRSNAADFVKTGSIVLRDNNSGLIRLTLNPESLGNVKISLELADNKITGKITVSSKEAYEAFNENLDGLSDAFVQGGFESAGFDLSWSGGDSSGYGQEAERGRISSPFYASSIPEVMSAGNTADMNMSGYRYNTSSAVNVFA